MTSRSGHALLLVGAGKMGGALLHRWLQSADVARPIAVLEPKPGTDVEGLDGVTLNPGIDALAKSDLAAVVIAVKPQAMAAVLPPLKPLVRPETVFLSIAAGTTVATMQGLLGADARIVRAMPNTPALIGRGATGLFVPPGIDEPQRTLCVALLAAAGEVVTVNEERQMDAVTAVSGSGPAYTFLLIEALAAAASDVGLPKDVALQLAKATVSGAAELARSSGETPTQLRQNVTSPGGTTEAALDVLMGDQGLSVLMHRAVRAAVERARQLNV